MTAASAAAAAASTSSGGPDPSSSSSVAHRRRLADVERPDAPRDDDGRHRGVRALFYVRRSGGGSKRASSVVDQSWVRNAVASLLGLLVLVGLLGSHRAVGGGDGGRLLQRVDGEALGWREENLTALARLSPDTPINFKGIYWLWIVPCMQGAKKGWEIVAERRNQRRARVLACVCVQAREEKRI